MATMNEYLNKALNEERLIKSIDVNIEFLYGLKSNRFKIVEKYIRKQLMEKMKGIKIDIDHKYE